MQLSSTWRYAIAVAAFAAALVAGAHGSMVLADERALDEDELMEQAATQLGDVLGQIYLQAKTRVASAQASVRYNGNFSDFTAITASLPERDVGFKSFEYKPNCEAASPSPICAIAAVFATTDFNTFIDLGDKLNVKTPLEMRFIGQADPVWKAPRSPKTYGGECGEATCQVGKTPVKLTSGMAVNSNEILACLRALCVYSASKINNPRIDVQLRGVITEGQSNPESRRAEVGFYRKLPYRFRPIVWSTFQRVTGAQP